MLAEKVGVSIPTISRCVTALRERGHDINAVKTARGWRFILASDGNGATNEQSGAPKG